MTCRAGIAVSYVLDILIIIVFRVSNYIRDPKYFSNYLNKQVCLENRSNERNFVDNSLQLFCIEALNPGLVTPLQYPVFSFQSPYVWSKEVKP